MDSDHVEEDSCGIALFVAADAADPGQIPTDRSKGGHADVVVSEDRAFPFYFVHQDGRDAEGKGLSPPVTIKSAGGVP